MTYDELETKWDQLAVTVAASSRMILAYQGLFDAAGIKQDFVEADKMREAMKTQIDVQCDVKIAQYRLLAEWKKAGSRK